MRRKVILFPTYEQALSYRKHYARTHSEGLLGVSVETPFTWLSDAWERFGSGTKLVSALERAFAVKQLLDSHVEELSAFSVTEGTVSLCCRFFSEVLGSKELEQAKSNPSAFSVAEQQLFSLIKPYRTLLSDRGLIETGDALTYLSQLDLPFNFELGSAFDMPVAFQRYFNAVVPELFQDNSTPVQISKTPTGVEPYLLLASGPSAQNALIMRTIAKFVLEPSLNTQTLSMLIVSADPIQLFSFVTHAFATWNNSKDSSRISLPQITCDLRANRPFKQTDFGCCFIALKTFLLDDSHDLEALLDYVHSPFSGINSVQASQITSVIQGNRLFSFEEAHAMIRLVSPHFDMFEELLQDSDASLVLDYFYDVAAEISGRDAAYRSEQGSAISALRSVYEQARSWHMKPAEFDFALEGITVDCSSEVTFDFNDNSNLGHDYSITITDSAHTQDLGRDAFDCVLLCDMDSRIYAAGERHDALTTLEKKLGITLLQSNLQTKRRWFESVKALASSAFLCERVLNSGGDEDVYPSFLWEEFVACYLEPGDTLDDLGMPPFFAKESLQDPHTFLMDESSFDENANWCFKGKDPLSLMQARAGKLSDTTDAPRSDLFLSRVGTYDSDTLLLSPSAIEAYINCPYYWFVSNRLRPESPKEELGPLEQGTFVHGVFEAFYKALPAEIGQTRLTKDNIKLARECFSKVFDEQLALQPDLPSTRYVPETPVEQAQAQKLKQTLLKNIVVQSHLMPEFSPTYGEFEIKPENGLRYAGVLIRGRVDRIDINAATNQMVVLDYKGGIAGHDAGYDPDSSDSFELPHKIQALIYAQVLKQVLPERPIGALYLSYRAQEKAHSVAGSYDDAFLPLNGFARRASAVKGNFDRFLSLVEEAVACRMEEMKQGVIDQRPLCPDSCKYCPVTTCPRRLS